jgi:hypothetical protein
MRHTIPTVACCRIGKAFLHIALGSVLTLPLFFLVQPAYAQTNNWTNSVSGKWEDGALWSLGIPPGNGQSIRINDLTNKTVTVDGTTAASFPETMTIHNLTVSGQATFPSAYLLSLVNAGSLTPLSCDQAAVIGSGGAISVMNSILQLNSGALQNNGTFTILSGGVLLATNVAGTGLLSVGTSAQSEFNLRGGMAIVDQFVAATNATLLLNSGTLTILHGFTISVSQSAPASGNIQIGSSASQTATWNILGGTNQILFYYPFSELTVGTVNAKGVVTIDGPNTVLTNTGGLYVAGVTGSLISIANGAQVESYYGGTVGSGSTFTITGNGTHWDPGPYLQIDGNNNQFLILNGAKVTTLNILMAESGCSSNLALISGSNSVLSTSGSLVFGSTGVIVGNSLIITNGGSLITVAAATGQFGAAMYNNNIIITGDHSCWTNLSYFILDNSGGGNSFVIKDGALAVFGSTFQLEATNSHVLVFGSNTIWNVGGQIILDNHSQMTVADEALVTTVYPVDVGGPYAGMQLAVTNGGTVLAPGLFLGLNGPGGFGTLSNSLIVAGGNLVLTNFSANAQMNIYNGTFSMNGGVIIVDSLLMTNGPQATARFSAGTISSKGSSVANGSQFVVGDGTNVATYTLLGGEHSFVDGLHISSNAFLTGCGTINGPVTVDTGGAVLADCGGTLTFTGIVTNKGVMRSINGTVLESYGILLNDNVIDIINGGIPNFQGSFVNNGVILGSNSVQISQISVSGNDILIQTLSVMGHSYQLQLAGCLDVPTWNDFIASQTGTGGVLTFIDSGGATNAPTRFYRLDVSAP